jgi:DtxR family Mn-dependent transcriptional regulator
MKRRDIDEHLETLWHLVENKEADLDSFRRHTNGEWNNEIIENLELKGYIKLNKKDKIRLTSEGEEEAKEVVRRHRLAERLLVDILGMEIDEAETGACEFEHVLASELTESICILLGHPGQCPHGLPIPKGDCCEEKKQTMSSAIGPLANGKVGEVYKVAYINTSSNSRMHKLMHFGVGPGSQIKLHQRYPSFVICSDNGQLAMEKDIAEEIYIWKNGNGKIK